VSLRTGSRILVAPDSHAAERALVAELSRLADADPLARKTVVVPSHSLRVALLARLAGLRPAWLGLEVVTLRGLARAILERAGREHHSGDALLPLVVERLARRERALAKHLETLVDGFAGAQGAVRDLLDAGFGEEHLEPALERLEEERNQLGGDALDRAAALCRIARQPHRALRVGTHRRRRPLRRGRRAPGLPARPDTPGIGDLPARFRRCDGSRHGSTRRGRPPAADACRPPEPWELDGESRGTWRFGRRLSERLQGAAGIERLDLPPSPARLTCFTAADPAREMSAAVGRLARLLAQETAAGERAEDLAIVVRDPAPYRAHLAREIDRQALPASGSDGPPTPLGRRARGLLELVERQDEASLGLAFAVAGDFLARGSGARPWELRLAALALGVRRLGAFVELSIELDPVPLPVNDRFVALAPGSAELRAADEDDPEAAGRLSLRSRTVAREALRRAQRQAAALLTRLATFARRQPLAAAMAGITGLVETVVELEDERTALELPLAGLKEAASPGSASFEITAAEAALLVREAWQDVGAAPLGGQGGGVALLSVTEARGRTFRRIVLAGLARDRFPRAVRADPFLPDGLRLRLRDLLPDLPVKREGHDEERFLFAQLLGAAPEIDLFTPKTDEEGKPLSASSFLDELRRAGRIEAALPAPEPERLSALDAACRTALAGEPAALGAALEAAYREGADRFSVGERPPGAPGADAAPGAVRGDDTAGRWTASHLALLAEVGADPSAPRAAALGPFFGFVGGRVGAPSTTTAKTTSPAAATGASQLDPRRISPAVTTLQGVAGCGWRTFLGKVLRLAAPLAGEDEIPQLPSRLTGTVVHAVLERMAPPALRDLRTLDAAMAHADVDVRWPEATLLHQLIATAAREALTEEGLDPELFALPLELAAAQALAVVEDCDWAGGSRRLLGLEVGGEAELDLPSGARRLTFRADRIERMGEALVLTDYKTGKTVVSAAAKADTRERHLEQALAEGEWLQLPAYARARAAQPVEGRLLFLAEDLADDCRDVRLEAPAAGSLAEAREHRVWQTLFDAWESGSFLPRLLDQTLEESFEGCAYCEVRAACVQGDTGARLRLERWARARLEGAPPAGPESTAPGPSESLEEKAWRLFALKVPRPHAAGSEDS
jgi:hypothetical protein